MRVNIYGTIAEINETTLEITGKTFAVKDNLKKYWSCTYNTDNKSWILPEKNRNDFISKFGVVTEPLKAVKVNVSKNTICPHCGTYCYGDCQA